MQLNLREIPEGLPDGKYPASYAGTIVSVEDGRNLCRFHWKLADGRTVISLLRLVRTDGSPNQPAIAATRSWAPDWDGKDAIWFKNHNRNLLGRPVSLHVGTRPETGRRFVFVNAPVRPASDPEALARKAFDTDVFRHLTSDLPCRGAYLWGAFCKSTPDWSSHERQLRWRMAAGVLAGKDQYAFTENDWAVVRDSLADTTTRT